MLKDNTEAIYRLFEKILQSIGHQEDKQRQVKDVWLLTTMFVSAKYFCGNIDKARIFIKDYHCSDMLSKSRFCRRLHKLEELSWSLFNLVGDVVKQCNESGIYCIDTFPVAVCHNRRYTLLELYY